MEHLIIEDSGNAQCTFSTSVVLRHAVPPLKKNYRLGNNYSNNEDNVNGVQQAGGMRQGKPAGLQGQRSCHGNFGKLVRKVGNAVTFPICIMPKNQILSFD